MRLSTSRASHYLRCPRSFKNLYVLERESRDTDANLAFGNAWHEMMEARWNLRLPLITPSPRIGRHETAILQCLYKLYCERYPLVEKVLECEQAHVIPIGDDELEVRFDAVIESGNEVFLMEHKTTASDISPGSYYWERTALDQQISWYYLAAQALGYNVPGVIYDAVRKPGLRRGKSETGEGFTQRCISAIESEPDKHFARHTVVRSKRDLESAQGNFHDIARMVANAEAQQLYPQNPASCFSFGKLCNYWDVCVGAADIKDNSVFQNRERA